MDHDLLGDLFGSDGSDDGGLSDPGTARGSEACAVEPLRKDLFILKSSLIKISANSNLSSVSVSLTSSIISKTILFISLKFILFPNSLINAQLQFTVVLFLLLFSGKYRSKYRRKRRSSSSSSEAETGNGKSTAAEAPPPPPVKRYYGRKRTETDEEKLTEDEDGPATE